MLKAALLMSEDTTGRSDRPSRAKSQLLLLWATLSLNLMVRFSPIVSFPAERELQGRQGRGKGDTPLKAKQRALKLLKKMDQWRKKDNLVLCSFLSSPYLGNCNSLPHYWNN